MDQAIVFQVYLSFVAYEILRKYSIAFYGFSLLFTTVTLIYEALVTLHDSRFDKY